jgi:uncharacterized protein YbaP (TraB family)
MVLAAAVARFVHSTIVPALACLAMAAGALPAAAQPAFWVIKDADSTIYLLGTIHVLRPDTVWRGAKLDAAMKEAEELWLELPSADPASMQADMLRMVQKHGLAPQLPLSKDLTPEEMQTLDEAAALAGLSASQLNVYRPWFAALTISNATIEHAGYDTESGVDRKVETVFGAREIAPKGFKTVEEQMGVFARMGRKQELAFLRETLEEYKNASVELDQMVSRWAAGDIDNLEKLLVEKMKDENLDIYQVIIVDRNASWADRIAEMLKGKGTVFIAVGAMHLIGPDSVLAMLKAKDIASERVQ